MSDPDYETYSRVCELAITDENVFNTFKQNWSYTYMLEQHHPGSEIFGNICCEYIQNNLSQYLSDLPWLNYRENDKFGNPKMEERIFFKKYVDLPDYYFSHTTIRYILTSINIYLHLLNKFGDIPDNLDIVEIGGGYGGQCKIMIDTLLHFKPLLTYKYTIIDLEGPSNLQKKYLEKLNVKNVTCSTTENYEKKGYDLCISAYTIGEVPIKYQEDYINNIILKCKSGYMLWNVSTIPKNLLENKICKINNEIPLFTSGNKTVIF